MVNAYSGATFAEIKSIIFSRAPPRMNDRNKNRRPNKSVGEIENVIQFGWNAPFRIELYALKAVDVFTACNSYASLAMPSNNIWNSSALRGTSTTRRKIESIGACVHGSIGFAYFTIFFFSISFTVQSRCPFSSWNIKMRVSPAPNGLKANEWRKEIHRARTAIMIKWNAYK